MTAKDTSGLTWKQRNPEKNRAQRARFRAAHPERIIQYRQDNLEDIREYGRNYARLHPEEHKAWRAHNPEKARAASRLGEFKRRQRLSEVRCDLTIEEWENIVALYGGRCAYCYRSDKPLTQDHVVPVALGGEHTAKNIVPACKSCNSRKGAKLMVPANP